MTERKFGGVMAWILADCRQPDEEVGSVDHLGWAGLYKIPDLGTYVIIEDATGYVSSVRLTPGQESLEWESYVQTYDHTRAEPEDGDYVIEDGRGGYVVNRLPGNVYNSDRWDEMVAAIKADMDDQNFWPNVWVLNDHGNYTLINIYEED